MPALSNTKSRTITSTIEYNSRAGWRPVPIKEMVADKRYIYAGDNKFSVTWTAKRKAPAGGLPEPVTGSWVEQLNNRHRHNSFPVSYPGGERAGGPLSQHYSGVRDAKARFPASVRAPSVVLPLLRIGQWHAQRAAECHAVLRVGYVRKPGLAQHSYWQAFDRRSHLRS
jgi:hypothetical protein